MIRVVVLEATPLMAQFVPRATTREEMTVGQDDVVVVRVRVGLGDRSCVVQVVEEGEYRLLRKGRYVMGRGTVGDRVAREQSLLVWGASW